MSETIKLICPVCKKQHSIAPPLIFTEESCMSCPKCGHSSVIAEWLLIKPSVDMCEHE